PVQRWPLGDPGVAVPRSRDLVAAFAVLALGAAGTLLHLPAWQRVVLLLACAGGLWRFASVLRARRARRPRGEVVCDGKGLARRDRRVVTRLADFDESFGVTVLANHLRTTAVVAFTTPRQTRFVTVRVRGADDAALAADVLRRATTIPDADAAGQGDDVAMSGGHAGELV